MQDLKRESGVLLHITCLPGKGPCGNLGPPAYDFIDFLAESGQSIWQILPLSPPSRGNSPYSSVSAFAGNPYFISMEKLVEDDLLSPEKISFPNFSKDCDYQACEEHLTPLLRLCYKENAAGLSHKIKAFGAANAEWLPDYALFLSLQHRHGADFRKWPRSLLFRDKNALEAAREKYRDEIKYHEFVQYLFFGQWERLRAYAKKQGVQIFGDVPIYIDIDSADLWANPGIFRLDENKLPVAVAGVPPDAFSEDGQLWGNPLYDWGALKSTGYKWWINRLKAASDIFDMVRIDHFRGLASYWAIPAQAESARDGVWEKGPGIDFLNAVSSALPGCRIIAEDLGIIDDEVRLLLKNSGLPGLSVLEFAFSWDGSPYLPHNITPDRVAYIGTHDNDTAVGWLTSAPESETRFAREYMKLSEDEGLHWGFLRALFATAAHIVIAQMQDVMGLGSEARMNIPSKSNGNWLWRLKSIPHTLAPKLRKLTKEHGRLRIL